MPLGQACKKPTRIALIYANARFCSAMAKAGYHPTGSVIFLEHLPDRVPRYMRKIRADDSNILDRLLKIKKAENYLASSYNTIIKTEINTDPPRRKISECLISYVIRLVAWKYNLDHNLIRCKSSVRSIAHARHVSMYLARTLTLKPYSRIIKKYGIRDHSTVIHGICKIKKLRASNPAFHAEITDLERLYKEGMTHEQQPSS